MVSIFDNGSAAPPPAMFNMADYVLRHAARQPDHIALEVMGTVALRYSYGEIARWVQRMAALFLQHGLTSGDSVMLRLGNRVEFPVAYLAAIYAGIIPVPTSAQLGQAEITRMAGLVRPDAVLADDTVVPDGAARVMSVDVMQGDGPIACPAPDLGDPNRHAYTVFTSGTSGVPTGVRHAHRAIWARRMMWDNWYGLRATDRVLHAGAFNWTYTLGTGLMDPWSIGATAIVPGEGATPDQLWDMLARSEATIFAAAPGVFRQMLRHAPPKLPALRHGLSAGERLSDAVRQTWRQATGTDIHEAFGMSECSTFISGNPDRPAQIGTSGRPQTGRRIAVLHDGAPVLRGETGQLGVSTCDPGLMLGYLGQPDISGDWFVTGDLAAMDDEDQITYHGRADDVMTAGGYRVAPLEVEEAFGDILVEIAVTEVHVKADVTVIALFYTGDIVAQDVLKTHAATQLARYKQPRLYIHLESLPKGANGKLNRRALRADYEASTHGQT